MLLKKVIPIGMLLTGNALLVVCMIVFSNQWWWQKLAFLDEEVTSAARASEQSQVELLELVNSRLPLNNLLAKSSFNTYRFITEVEFLVLDSSRDYLQIIESQQAFIGFLETVDLIWPKLLAPDLLDLYKVNIEIVIDIIDEVLDTSSPVQLQLLVEDLEGSLQDMRDVMKIIEEENSTLFMSTAHKVVSSTNASREHVSALETISSDIINQSVYFIIFGSVFILLLQLSLYYILQQRFSGLLRVMTQITKGGSLGERVKVNNAGDLIASIGIAFNLMLERLQSTHFQLEEQIERAESATQAKSDFLANMSHEIRTPVHAITGIIHLIKEQPLTAKLRDYTEKAETASEALVHVINDVLDFSKIAAGKIELENKPFEILPALEKHVDLFSTRFNAKNLDFVLAINKNVPRRVIGDELRLNQILINIINNALKFTHSGTVQLTVSCNKLTDNQAFLSFAVEDTGIGIKQHRIPLLFNAFSQEDVSTTRKYGGTGLGLAISQKLSHLMNGDIRVASELESGSTFTVTAVLGIDSNQQQVIFTPLAVTKKRKKVLYIGAQCKQSIVLEALLQQLGLHLLYADSLENAQIALLENQVGFQYELVLIDVPPQQQKPIELLFQEIAGNNQLLKLPIIFISAIKKKDDTVTEIQIIDRPVKPSQVYNALVSTLKLPAQLLFSFNNTDVEQLNTRQKWQQKVSGAHVLVVEDVLINQQIIREILNSGGVHICLANNGKEALATLETQQFDLVLMDLQMPIMGGVEATELIRKQAKHEKLPIIAITANVMKGVVDECKAVGFNDYLSKPLDVQALWEKLALWIAPAERVPFAPVENEVGDVDVDIAIHEKIPGVDLALGLRCVNDNKPLYCTLLADFMREYATSTTRLQHFFDSREVNDLAQLAHAIKGVSANLGLSALSRGSYAIEKLAKKLASKEDIDFSAVAIIYSELSKTYSELLLQVQHSIEHIINVYSAPKRPKTDSDSLANDINYVALNTSLLVLRNLIEASDGEALDVFGEIQTLVAASVDVRHVQGLEEQLNCFNFEEALPILNDIEQQIEAKSSASDSIKNTKG